MSATATSICGSRSLIDSFPTSSRRGRMSALTAGGSTWHSRISATWVERRSRKPTIAPRAVRIAHREPRAVAVAPFRAVGDRQHGFGLDLADALEAVLQPALLGRHLRALVGVLRGAAAADAEVRAERLAPAGGGLEDRGGAAGCRTWACSEKPGPTARSPGKAPSTNTTLPSGLRATPRPSESRASMLRIRSSRARGILSSAARRASRAQRAAGRTPPRSAPGRRRSA